MFSARNRVFLQYVLIVHNYGKEQQKETEPIAAGSFA